MSGEGAVIGAIIVVGKILNRAIFFFFSTTSTLFSGGFRCLVTGFLIIH